MEYGIKIVKPFFLTTEGDSSLVEIQNVSIGYASCLILSLDYWI